MIQQELAETTKPELQIHLTVRLRYVRAVDYHTYELNDRSIQYGDSVSYYILKIMTKLHKQMRTRTFYPADPISVLGFLTTFKLQCNAKRVNECAAMLEMPIFVAGHLACSLKSYMV